MRIPRNPKIYHIVHVDRLPSIVKAGHLWSDAEAISRNVDGTTIGMNNIKQRRLRDLTLTSHPGLNVGNCVPFYFCPRSIMLYLISRANHSDLQYRGGQGPIVHLEADLRETVLWAGQEHLRWAFTLSNAGSYYFEDRSDLESLKEVDWDAVSARDWRTCREGKQAEFLLEERFPLELVKRIATFSDSTLAQARRAIAGSTYEPQLAVLRDWYY